MRQIFPDYYREFKCIGGACRHNCCIGWEIDIDPDTAAFYDRVPGEMGVRLQTHISREGEPHFDLDEMERCPFLNQDNLCDIILNLGEEHICRICTEHPRFHNEFPGKIETGIGLCCEEAGRLILGKKEPVRLLPASEEFPVEKVGEPGDLLAASPEDSGEFEEFRELEEFKEFEEFLGLRNEVIRILQDRTLDIPSRIQAMLKLCDAKIPDRTPDQWAAFLLDLERLDDTWTKVLEFLRSNWKAADIKGFDRHMADRQTEYEQLLVYLVHRHLATAFDEVDLAARAAFAAFGCQLLHLIGAAVWTATGEFSFADQVELARLFSSEIEYSEENLDCVLDEMVCE